MLKSFLFSLATVILALGAPIITLSHRGADESLQELEKLNKVEISTPNASNSCPAENPALIVY